MTIFQVCCLPGRYVEGLEFPPKNSTGVEEISSEVPKFLDVYHVCLKTFAKHVF
jgi:hypothetical protein